MLSAMRPARPRTEPVPWSRLRAGFGAAVLFACMALASCRHGRAVTVAPLGPGSAAGPFRAIFSDFRQAFHCLDFSGVSEESLDPERRRLMQGAQRIMAGDLAGAEAMYRALALAADDAWVKIQATDILAQLFLYQSKWSSLREMVAPGAEGGMDLPLGEMSRAAAENYRFPEQAVMLPLELSASGTPLIPLQVNGRRTTFWLDTGSGFTVLPSDLAERFGVAAIGAARGRATTLASKRVATRMTILESLRIGELEIHHHPALIVQKRDLLIRMPGLFSRRRITKVTAVKGILGWNALKNLVLSVDYRQRRLRIAGPEKRSGAEGNLFWLGYPILVCRSLDGARLHFGLDSGARHSVVLPSLFAKIKAGSVYAVRLKVWGAGGEAKVKTHVLSRLQIIVSGHRFEFKDIAVLPQEPFGLTRLDGILGNDFLRSCASFTIDLPNGTFVAAGPSSSVQGAAAAGGN